MWLLLSSYNWKCEGVDSLNRIYVRDSLAPKASPCHRQAWQWCTHVWTHVHRHTHTSRRRALILCDCTPQGFFLLCWMSSLHVEKSWSPYIPWLFSSFIHPFIPSLVLCVHHITLSYHYWGIVTMIKQPPCCLYKPNEAIPSQWWIIVSQDFLAGVVNGNVQFANFALEGKLMCSREYLIYIPFNTTSCW